MRHFRHLKIAQFHVLPERGEPLSNQSNPDFILTAIAERGYQIALIIGRENPDVGRENPDVKPHSDKIIVQNVPLLPELFSLSPAEEIYPFLPQLDPKHSFSHPDRVLDAAFSRDGSRLATVCQDGKIRVFELRQFKQIYKIQAKPNTLRSVSWSRTGREIATGNSEGFVRVWRDGAEVRQLMPGPDPVLSAEYSADGMRLAAGSGGWNSVLLVSPAAATLMEAEVASGECQLGSY